MGVMRARQVGKRTADQRRPRLNLSNWQKPEQLGRPTWTAMRQPRPWEHGAGVCRALVPPRAAWEAVRGGSMGFEEYAVACREAWASSDLRPGHLVAWSGLRGTVVIESGHGIACACARQTPCHLLVAAPLLFEAGWEVWLWGQRWPYPTGCAQQALGL